MRFGDACVLVSVLGLIASTFGFPILALFLERRRERDGTSAKPENPGTLEILIPAHNEEALISATLRSIRLGARTPSLSVTVGLDHCTDGTRERAEIASEAEALRVRFVENTGSPGKWRMLGELVRQSEADWVALVDCGAQWRPGLLEEILPLLTDARTVAVAPSYCPENAGLLSRCNWRLESALKSVETRAGGPIAVHGATVFYRRPELARALAWLAERATEWINDDVAIPLAIRQLFPRLDIRYLRDGRAHVTDLAATPSAASERRRRQRMILGNLQWISRIYFPGILRQLRTSRNTSCAVSCIASRRVFRVFWAYWVVFGAIGASLDAGMRIASLPLVLALPAILFFVFRNRPSVAAFVSGLGAPLLLKRFLEGKRVLWN